MALFAASAVALYAAHHVGDYWVQTDHQAQHKGLAGAIGRGACSMHVLTYVTTQWLFLTVLELMSGQEVPDGRAVIALLVSGATHWMADRREHGVLFWLARRIPGKGRFLMLGVPRAGRDDNPSLGTGAWALDQAWHIFWGVFVAALVIAS